MKHQNNLSVCLSVCLDLLEGICAPSHKEIGALILCTICRIVHHFWNCTPWCTTLYIHKALVHHVHCLLHCALLLVLNTMMHNSIKKNWVHKYFLYQTLKNGAQGAFYKTPRYSHNMGFVLTGDRQGVVHKCPYLSMFVCLLVKNAFLYCFETCLWKDTRVPTNMSGIAAVVIS